MNRTADRASDPVVTSMAIRVTSSCPSDPPLCSTRVSKTASLRPGKSSPAAFRFSPFLEVVWSKNWNVSPGNTLQRPPSRAISADCGPRIAWATVASTVGSRSDHAAGSRCAPETPVEDAHTSENYGGGSVRPGWYVVEGSWGSQSCRCAAPLRVCLFATKDPPAD